MNIIINKNTVIESNRNTSPVNIAVNNLKRDINNTCKETQVKGNRIVLVNAPVQKECFIIQAQQGKLTISANDDLGFVYGIYEISRSVLGVHNFWFWNDQQFIKRDQYVVNDGYEYQSAPYRVKYRGWFINDEVLIMGWMVNRSVDVPWEMVFEALLRCGGNMTIPGTDLNSKKYRTTASQMGLSITHHHAEPLGAEMFIRAYPNLQPSYIQHKELFHELWRQGIEDQKQLNVIWNIGFRGQGDCPFWENDPQFDTMEARGKLMGDIIKIQYDMVKEQLPDAICCTNLYGETMELYRGGYLKLPDDVIKIWADNGFGKMVSRRQSNHNPRINALPDENDNGSHGIYYHASFYDLQAASQLTMLANSPEFIEQELENVLKHNCDDYWIINCSNVKPHVYYLDLISEMWRSGNVNIEQHRNKYTSAYYGKENSEKVGKCLKDYFKYALQYGVNEDDHAGEQFSNHVARVLLSQYMKDSSKQADGVRWATDAPTLKEQIVWYQSLCKKAYTGYEQYLNECIRTATQLVGSAKVLFEDSLLLQAMIHYHCFHGAYELSESLLLAMEEDYKHSFYKAGKAREDYLKGNTAMREREHGKWHNFYENECQADLKQTAWVISGLMSYVRNLGEGPHFYQWQREFQDTERDQMVKLLLNTRNHPDNDELYALMKEKWD